MPEHDTDAYVYECDTCNDDLPVKKMFTKKNRSSGCFGPVCDPVLDEIKTLSKKNLAYEKYAIVPFFDKGDATLRFFRKMKDYSPTHGGVIESIKNYVLGGELTVAKKKRAGFRSKENGEVSDEENESFIDFIEGMHPNVDGSTLLDEIAGSYENLKTYGNIIIRVDIDVIGGEYFAQPSNIDCEDARYLFTESGEDKLMLISQSWDTAFLDENPPDFVGVYPAYTENPDGSISTVIHYKNKVVGRDWYGQPGSISSLYFQYMEIQLGQFATQGYANEFTPKVFIETSGDPEDEFDDLDEFNQAIEDAFTNNGSKKRIIHRRKLSGDSDANVHQFESNTDHQFHIGMAAEAERQIIKSHNWSKVLMGIPTTGKLGNENERESILKDKHENVIRPIQKCIMTPWNKALAFIAEITGKTEVTNSLSLDLANLYGEYEEEVDDPIVNE